MDNRLSYEAIMDALEDEKGIQTRLSFYLQRCVLENPEVDSEGSINEKKGKMMFISFINERYKDVALVEKLVNKIKADFRNKEDSKGFGKDFDVHFYDYLSKSEGVGDEEAIAEIWKMHPKKFIDMLRNYRETGTADANIESKLLEFAKNINNDEYRYVYELIQNADDCEYENEITPSIDITIEDAGMRVYYPEQGMTYSDIIAITTIGQSNKRRKKRKRIIGEKGIGFKTIFSICDYVEIHSGKYHFKLSQDSFAPEWIEANAESAREFGTTLKLHFKKGVFQKMESNDEITGEEIYENLIEKYGVNKPEQILQSCPILFTNKLRELSISYKNKKTVMRRENVENDKWIVRYWTTTNYSDEMQRIHDIGEADITMEYVTVKKDVKFKFEEYISHYKDVFTEEEYETEYKKEKDSAVEYPIVFVTPLSIQCKEEINISEMKGNMYTYLPTYSVINAPISIQIPFELNEDRSCFWVEKMHDKRLNKECELIYREADKEREYGTTKWNYRLFEEAFVSREGNESLLKKGYLALKDKHKDNLVKVYESLPKYKPNNYQFFISSDRQYAKSIELINSYCGKEKGNIIFSEIRELELVKGINEEDTWLRFDSEPIYFDRFVSDIISKQDNKKLDKIYQMFQTSTNQDVSNVLKGIAAYYEDFERLDNLAVLGLKKVNTSGETLAEFSNLLLTLDYQKTLEELMKDDNASEYLPSKSSFDLRKKLEVLPIFDGNDTKYCSFENDNYVWLDVSEDFQKVNCNLPLMPIAGIKKSNGEYVSIFESVYLTGNLETCTNKKHNLKYCDLRNKRTASEMWKKLWNKEDNEIGSVIYFKGHYQVSFACIKAIIEMFIKIDNCDGEQDWADYLRRCLKNNPGENVDEKMCSNFCDLWLAKAKDFMKEIEESDENINEIR